MPNKAVQALMDSGADAFSNMYELYVQGPGQDSASVMTVRATGFKIPEAAVETYDKKYHGNAIKAVKPSLNFERKFQVTFRADAGYNLHEFFVKWHGMVGNPVTGGVANTSAHAEGKVSCKTIASTFIAAKDATYGVNDKFFTGDMGEIPSTTTEGVETWDFDNVWVEKVGQFEYKTDTSDALTFTVDFCFGQTNFPAYDEI